MSRNGIISLPSDRIPAVSNLYVTCLPVVQVSYVLDTEDIMCRRKRNVIEPEPAWRKARIARFLVWFGATTTRLTAEKDTADGLAAGLMVAAAAVAQS